MVLSVNRVDVTPNYAPEFCGRNGNSHSSSGSTLKICALTGLIALGTVGAAMVAFRAGKNIGLNNSKLSHLDIDLFKKYGKFEKGKAFLNGKEYSGKIYTNNGCELTYNNGLLECSKTPNATKYYNKGKLRLINHDYQNVGEIKQTIVERLEDGTRVIRKRKGGFYGNFLDNPGVVSADKNHDIITTIKPNGTITRLTKNVEYRGHSGDIFVCDKLQDLKTGKVNLTKKEVKKKMFNDDHVRIKRHVVIDGKKVTQELNSKGEVISSWTTEYNPKTKTHTRYMIAK